MSLLIARAKKIGALGEVPVSAVILDKFGRCIGHGSNCRNQKNLPLGHAELIAIQQAAYVQGDWRFNDCTLIVTLEPCPMCAGAIVQARMGQVIFGASDSKRGGLGGTINLVNHPSAHHRMKIISGVMALEVSYVLEDWFKQLRSRSCQKQTTLTQTNSTP